MKSILITSNAYFPNIGGIENSLRYLARVYRDKGYRVDVVVSDVNNVTDEQLAHYELLDGVHIHRYSTTHDLPLFLRPFSGLWSLKSLFDTLKRIKLEQTPELTISRFHTTTWLAKLAKLQKVIYLLPGVVKFQNHPDRLSAQSGLSKLKQVLRYHYHVWLQQNAMRNADQLAIFSENMRLQVNECYVHSNPLLLVKPGVDTARFSPASHDLKCELRRQFNVPTDKHVLLCIGRFVKAKGFMYALEALKNTQDTHLVLVGGGEEESVYREFVSSNGLEERVTFAGVLQDPTSCYQMADVFLMSSTYEPLGQTILEALSAGVPIIAFKPSDKVITATSELLSEEEAVFVEDLSSCSLANSLTAFFANPENVAKLSRQSREIAVERFSWEKLALRLERCE